VGKGQGVLGKKPFYFLPPPRHRTQETRGRPWKGGGAPATWCTVTAGKGGETKRRSRATDSATYLELGCFGEADQRPAVGLLAVVTGAALVVAMEGSGRRGNWSWRYGVRWGAGPALL
jgi:hypothetical protein